jgi:hypothetical protein
MAYHDIDYSNYRSKYPPSKLDRKSSPDEYNTWLATIGASFAVFTEDVSRAAALLNGHGSVYLEKFKVIANHVNNLIRNASVAYEQGNIEEGDLMRREIHEIVGRLRHSSKETVLEAILDSIRVRVSEDVQEVIIRPL